MWKFRAPFLHADFRRLYCTNLAEFAAATLVKLGSLQWLYEATGSGMALGGLGTVHLVTVAPATLMGGVLADSIDRKRLVSTCMATCCIVAAALCLLGATGALRPAHIYISTAIISVSRKLEASARASLLGIVVAAAAPRPRSRLAAAPRPRLRPSCGPPTTASLVAASPNLREAAITGGVLGTSEPTNTSTSRSHVLAGAASRRSRSASAYCCSATSN